MDRNQYSKEEIILEMQRWNCKSNFIKNRFSMYYYTKKKFPFLLKRFKNHTYPVYSKKELIIAMINVKNRSTFKKNHSGMWKYANRHFPGLINKILPSKIGLPVLSKRKLIKIMKNFPNRSVFQIKSRGYYKQVKKYYPDLIDKILPKVKSYSNSMGEISTKFYLETLFNEPFINTRPEWLKNPKTGRKLELDGYCEKLGIAFEYGSHDLIRSWVTKKEHKEVKYRDKIKEKICKKRGIKLIIINKDVCKYADPEKEFKIIIKKEFNRLNIPVDKIDNISFKIIYPKRSKYTPLDIWKTAKKYNRMVDFQRNDVGTYHASKRLGIFKKIQNHFKKGNYCEPLTKKDVILAIKKSKSYSDFCKMHGCYKASKRFGLRDYAKKKLKTHKSRN